jgi:hypothetical protein
VTWPGGLLSGPVIGKNKAVRRGIDPFPMCFGIGVPTPCCPKQTGTVEKEKPIGEVIRQLVRELHWDDALVETAVRKIWASRMGTTINEYTREIFFRKGKLYIRLNSPSLKQELHYEREKIRRMMHQQLGRDAISEVIVL